MYSYEENVDPVDKYQRSVRERANASLHELEDVLLGTSSGRGRVETSRTKVQLQATVNPRTLKWYEDNARPQKYKHAVSKLSAMLGQDSHIPQSLRQADSSVPSLEEAAAVVQAQTGYCQQLEAENRYIKDELANLRAKLSEIIEENKRLHEELKTSILQEIVGENIDLEKSEVENFFLADKSDHIFHTRELKHLQVELERLSSLHSARVSRLETQLEHSRSEIQKYEQMVEDLRSQLRMHDSIPTRENGEFVSEKQRNYLQITIDKLTRERDELMEHVTSLKSNVQKLAQREEEAYQQTKMGIEMVEQAQLEQTQAMVQKEQLAEELSNMKKRFDTYILDTQARLLEERESVRRESQMMIDTINQKLKEMTDQYAAASAQVDKLSREKVAYINEIDEMKIQLRRFDKEASMAAETYRTESTHASIQKSHASQEVNRLRKDLEITKRERDQEKSKMEIELEGLKRRLNKAERELVNSKEECIHLTTNAQALERELHLAKLAKESIERSRNEDLKAMTKRAQMREEELNSYIEDIGDKHERSTQEMDVMLKKQNRLMIKLRDECKRQAGQIEKVTKKNRNESGQLRKENEELRLRLQRALIRLEDLDNQSDQHGRVHEKMKERLKKMDDYAQEQGQQILDLLSQQSALLRDRLLLSREVEFLRKEITKFTEADLEKFFSSNKTLVDDIIKSVNTEEMENKYKQKSVIFSDNKTDEDREDLVDT
ncbi:serologically defined colon cancer antigen 8 homolog [Crassostrea angulata]|uniref:serologically defined colon cancer antigen 8 homolog n=1 Tax=Magallana angulata TaxID=2784310 RepID=UPI0022B1F45B|nr:serologically defined colon cancer antigen 8 homolog [Crassostrea angulata]